VAARIGRGVVLVPAAHERDIEREVIQDNDFRQNNTFFYLTGLETQDAWLLVAPGGETILFLPPRNPSQERWTGLRLGPDSIAARLSGIAHVLPTDSLDPVLASLAFHPGGGGGRSTYRSTPRRAMSPGSGTSRSPGGTCATCGRSWTRCG
jgi:hypothetical protein